MRSITAPAQLPLLSLLSIVVLALVSNGAAEAAELGSENPGADNPAAEEEQTAPAEEAKASSWSFKIGAGGSLSPNYEGSEDLQVSGRPQPLAELRWRSRNAWDTKLFAGTIGGVGIEIADTDAFSVGLKGAYGGGRSDDSDGRLDGLGDINDSPNGTLYGKLKFDLFALLAEVTHFFGGSDGTLVTLGAGTKVPLSEKLEFGFGLSVTLGDGTYMGEFFSVTQGQARDSGDDLDRFDADAGVKDVALKIQASYRLFESWELAARGEVSLLLGDAADSPVVERAVQPSLGLAVIYRF